MAQGWLKRKRNRLLFCYLAVRPLDGKRVEKSITIGNARLSDAQGWKIIGQRGLDSLPGQAERTKPTVAQICRAYLAHGKSKTGDAKAESTKELDSQLFNGYVLPRWGDQIAEEIRPAELQEWLDSHSRGMRPKLRNFLSGAYRHAQKFDYIPRKQECNPIVFVSAPTTTDYEATTITPQQAFQIIQLMPLLPRILCVLIAVTGLRISEALGLKWSDLDFVHSLIHVQRAWVRGRIQKPKSLNSRASVPMHTYLQALLLEWRKETPYAKDDDFIFASTIKNGSQPRRGDMLVQDYIRPCAIQAGVLRVVEGKILDSSGKQVTRFGFHNFRHALSTFLISNGTDPVVVQRMLRHSDTAMTLHYAHLDEKRKIAQGQFVSQFLLPETAPENAPEMPVN